MKEPLMQKIEEIIDNFLGNAEGMRMRDYGDEEANQAISSIRSAILDTLQKTLEEG